MRALALIPCRSGSKGLPGKHLMRLGGKTLLERAIGSAREATCLDRTLLTTDNMTYAAHAERQGCEVLMRPAELATDTAGMIPVMQHAVRFVEAQGERYDLLVLLQPTSPFRTGEDIDATVALVADTDAESAQTLVDAAYRPWQMVQLSGTRCLPLFPDAASRDLRRQDPPGVYQPSGSVYVVRRALLVEHNRIIGDDHRGLVCPFERSVNVNTIWDFQMAELIVARHRVP